MSSAAAVVLHPTRDLFGASRVSKLIIWMAPPGSKKRHPYFVPKSLESRAMLRRGPPRGQETENASGQGRDGGEGGVTQMATAPTTSKVLPLRQGGKNSGVIHTGIHRLGEGGEGKDAGTVLGKQIRNKYATG